MTKTTLRRISRFLLPLGAALALGACHDDVSDETATGPEGRLALNVQGLDLADVGDACYTVTVENGAGSTLWSQASICSDDYGNGTTDLTYIGTCDAANPSTTVTLELDGLYDLIGDPIPGTEFANPCPAGDGCQVTVDCVENADVPVLFDLKFLVSSTTGFVDVAVNIDYLECSAKVDCGDAGGAPLELLHNPATGERDQTIIVAFECKMTACVEPTYVYTNDIQIVCDEGAATISPIAPGPIPFNTVGLDLFAATLYRGQEALGAGLFNNVAIGIHPGTNCVLTAQATASDVQFPGGVSPVSHPYVEWSLPITDGAGSLVCSQHPLYGPDGAVTGGYPDAGGLTFTNEASFAAPAACVGAGGVCGDGVLDAGEQCDDGNVTPGDGCDELCQNEAAPGVCGDGTVDVGEQCDDGNLVNGDGCDEFCQTEGALTSIAEICPADAASYCVDAVACTAGDQLICEADIGVIDICVTEYCNFLACASANPAEMACNVGSYDYVGPTCDAEVLALQACAGP